MSNTISWQDTLHLFEAGRQPREISESSGLDIKLVYDNLGFAVSQGWISRVDIWFRLDFDDRNYSFLNYLTLENFRYFSHQMSYPGLYESIVRSFSYSST